MSEIVFYEMSSWKTEGHYSEKAQIWLEEALNMNHQVTFVTFGEPSVVIPDKVVTVSLKRLTFLEGYLNLYAECVWGFFRAWAIARRKKARLIVLTSTPPNALFLCHVLLRGKSIAQIVMNLGKDAQLSTFSKRCLRWANPHVLFACNTQESAGILSAACAAGSQAYFIPDPIGAPSAYLDLNRNEKVAHLLVPGDDDGRRSTMARLLALKDQLPSDLKVSIFQAKMSEERETEIRAKLPATHSVMRDFVTGRDELYRRFISADATLICYKPEVNFGSGNLVMSLICNRPVIVSRFPAALELAQQYGKVGEFFDEGDENSLLEAIKKIQTWSEDDWRGFDLARALVMDHHLAKAVCNQLFQLI